MNHHSQNALNQSAVSYVTGLSSLGQNGPDAPQVPDTVLSSHLSRLRTEGAELYSLMCRLQGLRDRLFGAEPQDGKGSASAAPCGVSAELALETDRMGALIASCNRIVNELETFG